VCNEFACLLNFLTYFSLLIYFLTYLLLSFSSSLTLLVGQQEGHRACKKTEWWGADMVICLERGADWHMAQLMPLPLTVSCLNKIQIGFTFLVPAHLGSLGQRAAKWVCVLSASLRIGPFHFQAGCRKRQLNLAIAFSFSLCVVVYCAMDACLF